MDRIERRGHGALVTLAVVGALGVTRVALDRYPTGIQLAVGLPALAAIAIGLGSYGFSTKSDKFKLAGLAVGIVVFSGLLMWVLHLLFPPVGPSYD